MTQAWNITDYGAVGDGTSDCTRVIQQAIDGCVAAGGGSVIVPAGLFRCGTVRLGPGVKLYLSAGAVLKGLDDPAAYNGFMPHGKPSRWHHALILADGAHDAGILGPGTIDGARVFDPLGEEKQRGPHTVIVANTNRFTLRDVTITDSANYAVFAWLCDDMDVHNLTVYGGWDAFHIRGTTEQSCRRVTLTGCRFFTGDDCIAGTHVDDLLVHNCLLNSSCNAIRWIGGGRRMLIDGCYIFGPGRYPHVTQSRHNSLIGITLQPGAWGDISGDLQDVAISNLTVRNVECAVACFARRNSRIGTIEIDRLTASGITKSACAFEAWGEVPMEAVSLRDVRIDYTGELPVPADVEVSEPHVGARPLPAWGLYARRVGRLTLRDVVLTRDHRDGRQAVLAEQIGQQTADRVHVGEP